MAYVGGKSRTCKEISTIIKNYVKDKEVREYYEPFCGGLSVACLMTSDYKVNCSDYNEDLIYFWNEVKSGNFNEMPLISKEYFTELKNSDILSLDKSFAMFWCTYMKFYRGAYIPDHLQTKRRMNNFHTDSYNSLKRKEEFIKLMNFEHCDYKNIDEKVKEGKFIIYCDPPYIKTTQPFKTKTFDSGEFWDFMKKWAGYGNYVFVSEKSCPIEHILLYEKNLAVTISNSKKTTIDKLFLIL